jgi:hypothetical protein
VCFGWYKSIPESERAALLVSLEGFPFEFDIK